VHASLLTTLVALPSALPRATSGGGSSGGSSTGGSSLFPFLFLILIFGAVYLFFIRPARRRQMAATQASRQVAVGDEIITTSGLIATVIEVGDDALTLEIAPGVRARYVPAAVLRVLGDEPEPAADTDVTNHEVIEDPDPPSDSDGPPST
jgi:preprotein translocase subunit YajC